MNTCYFKNKSIFLILILTFDSKIETIEIQLNIPLKSADTIAMMFMTL